MIAMGVVMTSTGTATEPVLPARVAAAGRVAASLGAGALLVSAAPSVRWLGIAHPHGVHVLVSGGEALAIAPEDAELPTAVPVERYAPGRLAATLMLVLADAGVSSRDALAIEAGTLAAEAIPALGGRLWIDAGARLPRARMRKDEHELALIAEAAALSDAGHAAVRDAVRAGVSELELWSAARSAMEGRKGRPLQAIVDLMVGERTALVGVPPSGASVAADAPILFDLAPRHAGYWADSCTTFAYGTPSARLRRTHDAVRNALEAGIAAVRPGARACDVDAFVRSRLDEAGLACPHHTGHGVGAAPQEEPWLRRDCETVLEEGMVVALEPGSYDGDCGVRLEHLLVVESQGARPLTDHSLSLT